MPGKFETESKLEAFYAEAVVLNFAPGRFVRVWNFEIRISNFSALAVARNVSFSRIGLS